MNYLQRFSLALSALRLPAANARTVEDARRLASAEPGEWLSRIHEIARALPPRSVRLQDGGPGRTPG
jgi:hypothetical protein